jgi:hypothetical protein
VQLTTTTNARLKTRSTKVVAVLSPETNLQKVIAALHVAGFSEESIGVLRGEKDAHKLDPAFGRHGRLRRSFEPHRAIGGLIFQFDVGPPSSLFKMF